MTVNVETPFKEYTVTTGVTVFPYTFSILVETDLVVEYTDIAGVVSLLVLNTDYTVVINPDRKGDITLLTGAEDGDLLIYREIPITQKVDWVNNDSFDMEILEDNQDKFIMIMQSLEEEISRAVLAPPGEEGVSLPAPDEGKALKWESDALINSTYNVDEQLEAAQAAQAAAEAAQAAAEHAANIAASKVDTVPVGTIIAWLGGYFSDGLNGGYTKVLDVTPAAAIQELETGSFKLCDGSEFYDADSPIFNAADRFLPNLTDERWLQGNTEGNAGGIGGDNDVTIPGGAHVHATVDHVLSTDEMPSHSHSQINGSNVVRSGAGSWYACSSCAGSAWGLNAYALSNGSNGGGLAHNHGDTESAGGGGGTEDNRPQYLDVMYAMKVKVAFITEGYEYFAVQITP